MKIDDVKNNQIKKIKHFSFLREKTLVVGIFLSISAVVSWYYWNNYQINLKNNSSLQYEKIVNSIRSNQIQALDTAEKFIINNKNIYGVLMLLEMTRYYVNKDELEKAVIQLKQALNIVKDNKIKKIIHFRLARIQEQQKIIGY